MCLFHKFSKIQDDGFQYCEKCGKAIHQHKWELTDVVDAYESARSSIPIYQNRLYTCSICGKTKIVKF